jgi:hypothetical protein
VEEVISGESPEVSEKRGRFALIHLLECKELVDVLLSQGGQLPHKLGPQHDVEVSFQRRSDNILYFHC